MRVLHIYKTYYPDSYGGIEQAIRHIANGTRKFKIKSEVFTVSDLPKKSSFQYENHHVHQSKMSFTISSTPFSVEALKKFRYLAREFDLLHFHYPYPFGDFLQLLSGVKKPTIVTYHSDIVRQRVLKHFYAPVQHLFLSKVDRIVCTSLTYLKTSKVLGKYRDKTEAVSLGLDKELYKKPDAFTRDSWRSIIGGPFFLFLGVLRSYKGVGTLIDSAEGLNAKLVIAGRGPELMSLKEQVNKLKLKNIIFAEDINDKDKVALISLCTGLVLPSHLRSEAFGLVQLEASIYQKPLICTELGTGTSYVNEHEITGLVVPPKNAEALRNAMNFMIFHPKIALRMGQNAEIRFEKLFSADKMCSEYARIYQDVLLKYKKK